MDLSQGQSRSGAGEDREEDVEDLMGRGRGGSQKGDARCPPSCPKWEIHSPPMQIVWPTHLKEPWDKGLMNPQLRWHTHWENISEEKKKKN